MPYSACPFLGVDVTPLVLTNEYIPPTLAETQSALARTAAQYPSPEAVFTGVRKGIWNDGKLIPEFMKKALQTVVDQEIAESGERREWEGFRSHRMFVEANPRVRIEIPTAHLVAEGDEMRALGEANALMCEEKTRILYKSKGGHGVPRAERDVRKVSEIIERTVERAGLAWSSM